MSKAASERYLTSDEKEKMYEMGKSIKTFLADKGLLKTSTEAKYIPKGKRSFSYESPFNREPYTKETSPDTEEFETPQETFDKAKDLVEEMKSPDITNSQKEKYQDQVLSMVDRLGETNPYFQQRIMDLLEPNKTYYSKIQDSNLAKKYGLQTKDGGYLKLDRYQEPIFDEEYRKSHDIPEGQNPFSWWNEQDPRLGKLLQDDFQSNREAKTMHSENFMMPSISSVTEPGVVKNIPKPFDIYPKIMKEGIKRMVLDPQEPWMKDLMGNNPAKSFNLNTLLDPEGMYMKNNLFGITGTDARAGSQPLSRIIKQVEEASPKEISNIDEKTLEDEHNAAIARAERGINNEEDKNKNKEINDNSIASVSANDNPFIGYTVEELKKMSPKDLVKVKQEYDDKKFYNELTGSNFSPQDLQGMSVKDITQATKVQDLPPFEMRFPSLIYNIETGKIPSERAVALDAIKALKELQSKYNAKVKNGSKILKTVTEDDVTKQWNPKTKKYDIVGKGWNGLLDDMLGKETTPDGGGGPGNGLDDFASGVSNAWNNVKNFMTNTTHFMNTPTPPVAPAFSSDDMYTDIQNKVKQKTGVTVPSNMIKAVKQQESSGKVDPNNYGLAYGLTPAAKTTLGSDYLPDTSEYNSAYNAANFLAKKSKLNYSNGSSYDYSISPDSQAKWYVQRYVGILPGGSRSFQGPDGKMQKVKYQDIVDAFQKILNSYQSSNPLATTQ